MTMPSARIAIAVGEEGELPEWNEPHPRNAKTIAAELGVHRATVAHWVQTGAPHRRHRRQLVFHPAALGEWLWENGYVARLSAPARRRVAEWTGRCPVAARKET